VAPPGLQRSCWFLTIRLAITWLAADSAIELKMGPWYRAEPPRRLGERCDREEPPLADIGDDHLIRCHLQPSQLGRAEQVDVTVLASAGRPVRSPD
jgi:hypothetical protein